MTPIQILGDVGELKDAEVEFNVMFPEATEETKDKIKKLLPLEPSDIAEFGKPYWTEGFTAILPVRPGKKFKDVLALLYEGIHYDS